MIFFSISSYVLRLGSGCVLCGYSEVCVMFYRRRGPFSPIASPVPGLCELLPLPPPLTLRSRHLDKAAIVLFYFFNFYAIIV